LYVKPEKFECEKTELSGVTDRSHKATTTSRPVTSLGHQRGDEFSERPKLYIDSMYENNGCVYTMPKTFFSGEEKVFPWGRSPPLLTGLVTR